MYRFTEEELEYFRDNISKNVSKIRKLKGFNQQDLAIELGLSNSSFISHAENPKMKTHNYSLEHLYKISKILNVPMALFFEDIYQDNQQKKDT